MTRYIIYITRTLNTQGAPPTDSSLVPDDLPKNPAMAKRTAKAAPREKQMSSEVCVKRGEVLGVLKAVGFGIGCL
ncbi:hypothetical protein F511_07832 [Dorcoceras hygrometricum]|uniref:Uncharacterized protein n=1 Tax=Dorcoceras hygrometricum TaxID=472368 RepID=A0A2Z7AYP4_9LAMI|nr:hypothetical protein F511_07832 [Dorcoceras hygrometricum]